MLATSLEQPKPSSTQNCEMLVEGFPCSDVVVRDCHSTEKRIANVARSYRAPFVALSQVRWTDGRRRPIHSGTTPTPFSTAPGYGCMKSLANTPHCQRASERLAEVCLPCPQTSSSCPRLASFPPSTRLCTASTGSSCTGLDDSPELLHPHSLHSISIGPASAAPAASF